MFTLTRPFAAIALAVLAALAAPAFWPLYRPDWPMPNVFAGWLAACGVVVGWAFLGARIDRRAWMTVFVTLQAVVLTVLLAVLIFGIREVFVQGYARRFREPMEAFNGFFEITGGWLRLALERDFLMLLGVGGVVAGVVLHILHRLMERRRLRR